MFYSFHIFSAFFETGKEADEFISEQWLPEPGDEASDEEYEKWESNNPTWKLEQELGFYMDSDFIEQAHEAKYVKSLIRYDSDKELFESRVPNGHNTFVIVGADSIYGDKRKPNGSGPIRKPEDTSTLKYLGLFNEKT